MAFLNDPGIPDYSIRVMRDGTEAEIIGGFGYGLTNDFEKILKASDRIRGGASRQRRRPPGRGREDVQSHPRPRSHHLRVGQMHVGLHSGLAGGRERFLRKDATLGFHRGSLPGRAGARARLGAARSSQLAGFDAKFIDTALSTPHSGMWRPHRRSWSAPAS